MLDAYARPLIDPPLNALGKRLVRLGCTANGMTLVGFIFGVLAIAAILFHQLYLAAFLIICNRLADGLDGAIARQSHLTDFGGFLDIVCDFIIYGGIVFAFGLSHPTNLLPACFLLFSFIGPMVSFLAYAIIAGKQHRTTQARGKKSFYYLGGLCEGTETAFVLVLFCILPPYFREICLVFGGLCWVTTGGRLYRAWRDFGEAPDPVRDPSS